MGNDSATIVRRALTTLFALALGLFANRVQAQVAEQEGHVHATAAARFLESENCALCHAESRFANAMRDSQGKTVAPFDLWSGSMMANSSRDPYWKAVLSVEVATTPSQKEHIESVCTKCHAPMAAPVKTSSEGQVLSFLEKAHEKAPLGNDGVSCTVCHQISAEKLGTDESFTGEFVINEENQIFGPHTDPFTMPMQRHVGYTPTKGDHILSSAMCATCHTVITESFDKTGNETHVKLHEQSPYLEWRNSIYNNELVQNQKTGKSCQFCHVPQTDSAGKAISTSLAHNPGGRDFPFLKPRAPFGRHTFAGGNVFMTQLIRDNRETLGVMADASNFDRVVEESRKLLSKSTANLTISKIQTEAEQTLISLAIQNLSGHKLPTAYPSRRVWIRLIVKDATGEIVFSSGNYNEQGAIVDGRGKPLASEQPAGPIQPHFDRITRSDEVQIYETFMNDSEKTLTFALLRGTWFRKDNRLLPKGWQSDHKDAPSTAPVGTEQDSSFQAGSDTIHYLAKLSPGKYRVEAQLVYQSLSGRYVAELFENTTKEVEAFREMYSRAKNVPEIVAEASSEFEVPELTNK